MITKEISFTTQSKDEARTIHKIAVRAAQAANAYGVQYDVLTADMDITAVHVNTCPLRLNDLLAADDANFAHDVFGIRRHLNRQTGELGDCFLPRFADV